jgi:hypothetical protein
MNIGCLRFPVENGKAIVEPYEVPPFLFNPELIDWGKSSLQGMGHEFVEVRVVRRKRTQATRTQAKSGPITSIALRRLAGPPSMKDLIREAIKSLYEQGTNLDLSSSIQVGTLVHRYVAEARGISVQEIKGCSDETIRRVHREITVQRLLILPNRRW